MSTRHTTQTNPYGSLCAEVYDLDKPVGALPDVPFYLDRLASVAGPILEPAVGTGRLFIPILEAGHEAAGFDPSAFMLANCRRRCEARGLSPDLRRARFQDFAYDRRFAAIIVPVTTFGFVDDFAEALAVLRRFHDHLEPGGLLMIDLPMPGDFWPQREGVRSWTAENGDWLRFESRHVDTDPLCQRSVCHMRYERFREGRLIETELEVMSARSWGWREFEMALERTGFGDIRVFGDYDRTRPPRRSDRGLTFEAVRP